MDNWGCFTTPNCPLIDGSAIEIPEACPPTQDASHHQVYDIVGLGDLCIPSFCH